MRKIFFYPVTAIIFLIIQVVVFKHFKIQGVYPDIFLLGTIYFALKHGCATGMNFGFFSGLLQDTFLIGLFGANALVKTLIGFVVGLLKKKIYEDNIVAQIGIVFLFCFLYYWCILFLQFLFGKFYHTRPFFQSLVFAAYNGIIAPAIFIVFKFWEKKNVAEHRKSSGKEIS